MTATLTDHHVDDVRALLTETGFVLHERDSDGECPCDNWRRRNLSVDVWHKDGTAWVNHWTGAGRTRQYHEWHIPATDLGLKVLRLLIAELTQQIGADA